MLATNSRSKPNPQWCRKKIIQAEQGADRKSFSSEQLARGINLAGEFPRNPFAESFAKVDAAVAAKQAFETKQIKEQFRSQEAKTNSEGVVERT